MAEEKLFALGVTKPRPQLDALANFRMVVISGTNFDEQWSLACPRSKLFA